MADGGNPMSASQRLSCGLISPIIVAAAAALSGCSDTTVADHAACKAKAYEVFKVSPDDWNHAMRCRCEVQAMRCRHQIGGRLADLPRCAEQGAGRAGCIGLRAPLYDFRWL